MILTKLALNYLISLMFGFYTGLNKYKLLFILIILITVDIILISSSVTIIGGSETTKHIANQVFHFNGLLTFISFIAGAGTGIWLKEKSKKIEKVNQ